MSHFSDQNFYYKNFPPKKCYLFDENALKEFYKLIEKNKNGDKNLEILLKNNKNNIFFSIIDFGLFFVWAYNWWI